MSNHLRRARSEMSAPKLRFKEFKSAYSEVALGSIGEFKNGINKSKEDFGFGVPFVNLMDVFGKPFLTQSAFGLVNASAKEIDSYNLIKGDVLFIRSSVKPEGVGEASTILEDFENTVYSGFLIRFRETSAEKMLDINYKKYCFSIKSFRKQIMSLCTTSANTNINQDSLNGLKISIPNREEQCKIALFLSKIDQKISLLTQKHELLIQYKNGVMQKIFSQEIRFKDKGGKDFPEWGYVKLEDIAYSTTGSSNRADSSLVGQYTFFDRSVDIRTSDKFLFDCEAIIVGGEGQSFIPKYFVGKFDLHQRAYAIKDFKNCDGKYIYYHIDHFRNYFLSKAVGSTVKSLRLPMFNEMPVGLPSIDEQKKISAFLTNLDEKIATSFSLLKLCKQYKQGLLQQMFI